MYDQLTSDGSRSEFRSLFESPTYVVAGPGSATPTFEARARITGVAGARIFWSARSETTRTVTASRNVGGHEIGDLVIVTTVFCVSLAENGRNNRHRYRRSAHSSNRMKLFIILSYEKAERSVENCHRR